MTVRCSPKNFHLEYTGKTRTKWLCIVKAEHSLEDVLDPDYFGNQANAQARGGLQVGDVIEIDWEDETKFGELKVRAIPKGISQVACVLRHFTEFEEAEFPAGYEAVWKGGVDHYALFRDEKEVEVGFRSADDAAVRAWALQAQENTGSAVRNAMGKAGTKKVQTRKTAAKKDESEAA